MSPALEEQDYMGLSSASPDKLSAFSNGALGLEDTELRLGLPGFASLERGVGGLALGLAKGRFLSGGKRGFSYAIDGAVAEEGSSSPANGENAGGRASKVAPSPAAKAQVVGWPPVRSYRKNALASPRPPKNTADAEAKPGEECLYVKVSFDGAPYLRKVDLKTYSNYKELSLALQSMFTCFTTGSEYVVTYEDRDGDWMLVGDVPWEVASLSAKALLSIKLTDREQCVFVTCFIMFADSCRRLRIMKGSDAIGIGAFKECCKDGSQVRVPVNIYFCSPKGLNEQQRRHHPHCANPNGMKGE